MPEKRKGFPSANVGDRPVTKPRGSKTGKSSEADGTGGGAEGTAVVAQRLDAAKQLDTFEAAMRLFHLRQLPAARQLFETAAGGPELDVSQRARLHMAMCDQRLQRPALELRSAEECYNYGIAMINLRRVAEARVHLERALEMEPGKEHVYYALALAQALGGDMAGAYANLKHAIELEPRNRIVARQDADFAHLATQAPFDSLLYPEKKGW
jgi:tetratricopeptide (TPR) repeat protein